MSRKRTNSANRQNRAENQPTHHASHARLEPLSPEAGVEMYEADRRSELRKTSLQTHRSALRFFETWCSQEEIENLNELTGRDLHRYRVWRREEAPQKVDRLSKKSEQTQQKIIRQFIRYLEQVNAVTPGLHELVRVPTVAKTDAARTDTVDTEQAREILDWLGNYEYASLEHVVLYLLADTGARIGTIVALDLDDYRPNADPAHLRVKHRPETGSELKNGVSGERLVAVSDGLCSVVDDYINHKRKDVPDDYNRNALLTTSHGRISRGTIRKYVYKWTRPCQTGQGCPHERDPDTCEATKASAASKCPSSRSPHAIRRGYISHQLASGVDRSYVGGRCDLTEEVLADHYDARDERTRMEVRRRALDQARRDFDGYGGR